jgi:hypothetical protein
MPSIHDWYRFVITSAFEAGWARAGLTDSDLASLESILVNNPRAGAVVSGTGGLRKIRFARPGGGKSGGVRVGYAWFPGFGVVLLGVVYAKNEKGDLSPTERATVKTLLEQFEALLADERQRQENTNG